MHPAVDLGQLLRGCPSRLPRAQRLPGSQQLECLMMTPFTPRKMDNMIAWPAARCDFPDYGKMLFYELPKDKLIFRPNQIGAMIDQSTLISQQLTFWDPKGSGVIRGKFTVIQIENSFLDVVPLYLKAEGTNFPQLRGGDCCDGR